MSTEYLLPSPTWNVPTTGTLELKSYRWGEYRLLTGVYYCIISVAISSISYWSPNLVNPLHISLHSLASVITWWKMISCLSVTASLAGASVIVLLCIYSQQIQTGVAEEKTEKESEKEWLVNKQKKKTKMKNWLTS